MSMWAWGTKITVLIVCNLTENRDKTWFVACQYSISRKNAQNVIGYMISA